MGEKWTKPLKPDFYVLRYINRACYEMQYTYLLVTLRKLLKVLLAVRGLTTREQLSILSVYQETQNGDYTLMGRMVLKLMSMARNMKQPHLLATCVHFIIMTSPVRFVFRETDLSSRCFQVRLNAILYEYYLRNYMD